MVTVSHSLASALLTCTDATFGLMGNGNAHLIDALEWLGRPILAVRHEVAAVAAADAHHRVSRRLAAATTTYGPGFLNTLTALAEARAARIPLLLLTGTAPVSGLRPFDVDQEALAGALGVDTLTVRADYAAAAVIDAAHLAITEATPVVVALPHGLAGAPSTDTEVPALRLPMHERVPVDVTALLADARRPLILAGRGAREAADHVRELAVRLGADVATTAPARGLFHGLAGVRDLGVCGGFNPGPEEIRAADVVLVLGAALNQFTMDYGEAFGEGARVIQVDLAPAATHPRVDVFLRGDVADVVADRRRPSPRGSPPPPPETGAELAADGRLDPRALFARLNAMLPADRLVSLDGGHFIAWPSLHLDLIAPDHLVMQGTAVQSIGMGFGAAVGVAAAAGERLVVAVTGDGGGLMGLADLDTLIRVAERCLVVVVNDAAYGAEIHQYAPVGLSERAMLIEEVDFAGLARSLGARADTVRTHADLAGVGAWLRDGAPGTYLVDCRVSRSVVADFLRGGP